MNVKITGAVNTIDADALADRYCATRGYAIVGGYEKRLVVQSSGYVRFESLRCQLATGPRVE